MDYSKQRNKELYNKYKQLKQETTMLAQEVSFRTGNIKGCCIPPEKIIELNELANELWVNHQTFLDTLQPDEKTDIQKEAEKNLSD
jgi:pectate lyase